MFCGPHGIGKTETAKALAKKHNLFFIPSQAAALAKEVGYDMSATPMPGKIAGYQDELLTRLEQQYKDLDADLISGVFDRSPLDLAIYTSLMLQKERSWDRFCEEYLKNALEDLQYYCDILIVPKANLHAPYTGKDKRPSYSPEQVQFRLDYQTSIDTILPYLHESVKQIVVPEAYQYEKRLEYIEQALSDRGFK